MSSELLKEGLKKFWILPLILTILLVLVVPLYMTAQKSTIEESAATFEQIDATAQNLEEPVDLDLTSSYKELAGATIIYSPYAMFIILILPIVLGVQLFGHSSKTKNRLQDFIDEKGLTKKVVYKTNIVTGIILSIMPIVVTTILLVLLKAFAGMGDYITTKVLVNWTCLGVFASILFFAFTALIGFITKNRFIQVLYTYGLLFIPVFMVYLLEIFMTKVIYGFPGFSTGIIELLNEVPSIKVCQMFTTNYVEYTLANSLNIWFAFVYALITFVIIFVGYKLFNLENKEKVQTVGDKIFKYMWIFIIGAFLYTAFMYTLSNALYSILITVGLFLLVYIIKELITKRSIKALLNGKRYYIMSIIVVLAIVLLSSDLFGYEKKVPELSEVEYVTYTVAYPNEIEDIELRSEENINNIIEKHKNFVLEKNEIKNITSDEYTRVYLQYKLKNGERIIRSYDTILTLDEPMFKTEEYIKQKYSYMYDNKDNIDILKIAGKYNDKTFIFEANKYENTEILNEVINCIANDLLNYNVHMPASGEYLQYSEKEGIQLLQIGLLDGMSQYTTYLYYLNVDDECELVKKLQTLIDEESEFITWYGEDEEEEETTE